jgi:hypothetical protein
VRVSAAAEVVANINSMIANSGTASIDISPRDMEL